jgi:hypothetical protein
MARQPTMPKALSSLQSVQRSYTSEFSVAESVSELVAKERREGTKEFKGFSAEELVIGRVRRDSAVIVCNCELEPNKSS